ncbi:MAG: peptide deformylase [Planctomycetes bacterium]|nr:peptide deformylase [Planctomycetota bacterium]
MDIILYPDPRLRARNQPITSFDAALAETAEEMFELMYKNQGVGLAAPQVGANIRLMVFNPGEKEGETGEEIVLCNPKIVAKSKDKEHGDEGCLSFPGVSGSIARHLFVRVTAQNLQGEKIDLEFRDWEARVFQHEFDHLDGLVFVERMTAVDKTVAKPILEELRADWADAQTASQEG